jgi:hypothetical protein
MRSLVWSPGEVPGAPLVPIHPIYPRRRREQRRSASIPPGRCTPRRLSWRPDRSRLGAERTSPDPRLGRRRRPSSRGAEQPARSSWGGGGLRLTARVSTVPHGKSPPCNLVVAAPGSDSPAFSASRLRRGLEQSGGTLWTYPHPLSESSGMLRLLWGSARTIWALLWAGLFAGATYFAITEYQSWWLALLMGAISAYNLGVFLHNVQVLRQARRQSR